jgi:hypothetical protein
MSGQEIRRKPRTADPSIVQFSRKRLNYFAGDDKVRERNGEGELLYFHRHQIPAAFGVGAVVDAYLHVLPVAGQFVGAHHH